MIKQTPPMGWNTWNTFGADINEELIFAAADKMCKLGLKDKGYEYLVIDDCWSLKERDKNGRLVPDPDKFPNGMKKIADYIHSKGLKFGMYSCAGNLTCARYPGSFEHEFIDAATFAEWEVDFLKYDYCFHSPIIHGKYLYRRMGIALENCGRDILFSACSWGADNTNEWIRETGASMWRSTGDIFDKWESVKDLAAKQAALLSSGGVGCFNDMDMLIVGMNGEGNVGLGGCNNTQYKTHFSLWAFMGSPLMIGCDLRKISKEALNILTNEEIIRINQDPAYRQPYKIRGFYLNPEMFVFAKQLSDGDIAIGIFNLAGDNENPVPGTVEFNLDEIGLPHSTGKTLLCKELWTGEEYLVKNSAFVHKVDAFDSLVFRCKVVDTE